MEHRTGGQIARAAMAMGQNTLNKGRQGLFALPFRVWMSYLLARRWLFIAAAIGAILLHFPTPTGLTEEGHIVLVMSVVATILFITEPIPLPAVALLIVVGEVLLIGLDSSDVARSLMSDSVLFIMGSLMIAVAVVKQKLDKRLAFLIVRFTGTKTANVCMGISMVSGVLASFIGEHTVAAMMLPVGVTLIRLTSDDSRQVRSLAAVLLFSISYGASIAGVGTPSGGARNAIMIGYWREFFYDPANPESWKYAIDYLRWMIFAYPLFLIQVPFVTAVLFHTFKPKQKNIARAVVRLRAQLADQGAMKASDWGTILIFFGILLSWIFYSDGIGLGTVAVLGAAIFLIFGLVGWDEINNGVNWGVVLLYAAVISLGVEMKDTGAALWVAENFLAILKPFGGDTGLGLWAAVVALTATVTNTMSNGAAVAVLGPIVLNLAVVAGEDPLILGFLTAVASSFAYLTVVGTPACTIVYSSGYLRTTDFLKAGWKMVIVSAILSLVAASFYWPLVE